LRPSALNSTYDVDFDAAAGHVNSTFRKDTPPKMAAPYNSTFTKEESPPAGPSNATFRKDSGFNSTFHKTDLSPGMNSTFSKGESQQGMNSTFSKGDPHQGMNSTFSKGESQQGMNSTFSKGEFQHGTNSTFSRDDSQPAMNATFRRNESGQSGNGFNSTFDVMPQAEARKLSEDRLSSTASRDLFYEPSFRPKSCNAIFFENIDPWIYKFYLQSFFLPPGLVDIFIISQQMKFHPKITDEIYSAFMTQFKAHINGTKKHPNLLTFKLDPVLSFIRKVRPKRFHKIDSSSDHFRRLSRDSSHDLVDEDRLSTASESSASHRLNDVGDVQQIARMQEESELGGGQCYDANFLLSMFKNPVLIFYFP
jgi:hypothetical protein